MNFKDQADHIAALFLDGESQRSGVIIQRSAEQIRFRFIDKRYFGLANFDNNALVDLLSAIGDIRVKFRLASQYDNQHHLIAFDVIVYRHNLDE